MIAVPADDSCCAKTWRERNMRLRCVRRLICAIDRSLRRAQGIFEYSASEGCLLRIALTRTEAEVRLADGGAIGAGVPVGALHLWNEHIPPLPARGATFAWTNRLRQRARRSLEELAAYVETGPGMAQVAAFRARIALADPRHREKMLRVAARLGFVRVAGGSLSRSGFSLHDMAENFWLWGLVWAFNPRSLRQRSLMRQRDELWIPRHVLIGLYGSGRAERRPGLRGEDALAVLAAEECAARPRQQTSPPGTARPSKNLQGTPRA